jgi:hypothetical protein
MKYKTGLSRYYDKMDKHKEHKAKVFMIIKGQYSLMMKNKVESMTNYKKWEEDDTMVELLNGLKELSFSTVDIQYEYWMVSQSLKSTMMMRQQDKESLNSYYKRFINLVDVAGT